MRIRSLLLAGAVFPLAMSLPVAAQETTPLGFVLAQAEQPCPEGEECPPAAEQGEEPGAGQGNRRQRAIERALRRQQELQQQGGEAPAAEPPAAEAPPAEAPPAEPPAAAEAPPPEPPPAEAPAAVAPPPEPPAEETVAEPPAAEAPAEAQAPAAEPAPDAAEAELPRRKRQRRADEPPAAEAPPPAEAPAEPQQAAPAEPAPEQPAAAPAEQPVQQAAPEQPEAAPEVQSTTEQQLEAQGDEEQADRIRALRQKLRRERRAAEAAEEGTPAEPPAADAAPSAPAAPAEQQQAEDDDDDDDGRQIRRGQRWRGGGVVIDRRGDRVIIQEGDQIFIQPIVPDEGERLLYGARDVEVEELQGGFTRTIVYRDNGSEIITIRDPAGNVVRRIRRTPDGREVVLIDNRFEVGEAPPPRPEIVLLPPPVIQIPQERYIVDIGRASRQQLQDALLAPPVQEIERPYTLEEVTRSESLRSYVPRIDLDTITFEFGSATISSDQMQALAQLGLAMEDVIAENPDEVYLIEGHTDAVGSDYDNLILSDRRAEAVAVALSQNFDIPPENLVTEGYGEQYLKVPTEGPSRENRRVTVRRITPLLQTSEAAQ